MNTRAAVELVILNVGLNLHIISPGLFSIMVIMTLFTTLMTTPLLEVVYSREAHLERGKVKTIGTGALWKSDK